MMLSPTLPWPWVRNTSGSATAIDKVREDELGAVALVNWPAVGVAYSMRYIEASNGFNFLQIVGWLVSKGYEGS